MSGIEWTDRSDWNPTRGCTRVSEGCRNCYAERIAARFSDQGQPFHGVAERTAAGPRWTGKVELIEERLSRPLRWRKPARIFVNSTHDLFHESVPDEWIDRVFAVMALAPQHTFQLLTKRPLRMLDYLKGHAGGGRHIWKAAQEIKMPGGRHKPDTTWPVPNVWIGVSCEDQPSADKRIPLLLQVPAAVRFVSAEPLLGPINLAQAAYGKGHPRPPPEIQARQTNHPVAGIDWVIAGGESGPRARPCELAWIRSIVKECREADVPCFVKQLGARPIIYHHEALQVEAGGGRVEWDDSGEFLSARPILRSRAGSDPAEWPVDLANIRQFP